MDDFEFVRAFRAGLPQTSAELSSRAKQSLSEAIAAEARPHTRRRRFSFVAGKRRIALAAGAIAIALAVAFAPLPGEDGGTESAAARALRAAATVAGDRPVPAGPRAGEFVYTKSRDTYLETFSSVHRDTPDWTLLVPHVREAWIGPEGGRVLSTRGEPEFFSKQDRAAWKEDGSPDLDEFGRQVQMLRVGHTTSFRLGERSFRDLSALPTDPDALLSAIEERDIVNGPPGDAETFVLIGELLRENYAPPSVRAALYEVAAQLPGVELVGTVEDAAGREGVAVGYTDRGERQELIFDPNTSALLGERTVVTDPEDAGLHAAPGAIVGKAAYLESEIVSSTSERPGN
jgi:hypothetical protein